MNRLVYGLLLSALPLSAVASLPDAAVGPGGVAHAVAAFAEAVDAADADALRELIVADDPGLVFGFGADGGLEQLEDVKVDRFRDVDAAGARVAFAGAKEYVAGLLGSVRAAEHGPHLMRTHVHAVYANCASERCSWAIVDLVREYGADGEVTERVPLRATALMRYTPQGFRIFHWHASRTR